MSTTTEPTTHRQRQPRERSVPCRGCHRPTWDVDALCPHCAPRFEAMGLHPAGRAS